MRLDALSILLVVDFMIWESTYCRAAALCGCVVLGGGFYVCLKNVREIGTKTLSTRFYELEEEQGWKTSWDVGSESGFFAVQGGGFAVVSQSGVRVVRGGGQPGRALVPKGIVCWRAGRLCGVSSDGKVDVYDDGSRVNTRELWEGYGKCSGAGSAPNGGALS